MEPTKKQTAIFYIKKDEGILYINKLSRQITVNFPKDAVDNLEVINKDKLQILIKSFIQKHKILPTNIIFVLDKNMTFEKDIEGDPLEQPDEIEKFLDIVPFERILSKVFRTKGSTKIIATNQQFYEELANSFEEEKFSISSVVPFSIVEKLIPLLKKEFDGKQAFSKIATLKSYSLLEPQENQEKLITYDKPQVKSPKFIFLIATLIVLLIILFILIYTQVLVSPPKKTSLNKQPVQILQSTQSGNLKTTPTK